MYDTKAPVLCWFKQAVREVKVGRAHNDINLQAPYGLHPFHISTCIPRCVWGTTFSASFVREPPSVKSNTFNNGPILT